MQMLKYDRSPEDSPDESSPTRGGDTESSEELKENQPLDTFTWENFSYRLEFDDAGLNLPSVLRQEETLRR